MFYQALFGDKNNMKYRFILSTLNLLNPSKECVTSRATLTITYRRYQYIFPSFNKLDDKSFIFITDI